MKKIVVGLIFSLFCGLNLFGNDVDLGLEAYGKNDFTKANELWEKACNNGNTLGCYMLGVIYFDGKGIKQDYSKAKDLFEKACTGGVFQGCNNLGTMYENANGVKQDYNKAKVFYEKACNGGVVDGCSNLGVLYTYDNVIKQDFLKANELFKKACDGGYAQACFNLGINYYKGKGINENLVKANELFSKACNLGLQEGCEVNEKLNINKLSNYIFEDLNFKVESIKGDTKNLTLSFEIRNTNENIYKIIDKNKTQVINSITSKLEEKSIEELSTISGKNLLKSDILEIIQNLVKDETNLEIFFTKFIIK